MRNFVLVAGTSGRTRRIFGRMASNNPLPKIVLLSLAGLAMMWYSSRKPCEIMDPVTPSKTHILILTSWRSGSSFVGHLFNQNPNVFYLTEPGWHVWSSMPNETFKLLHMPVRDLLRSIYSCDMSTFQPYMKRYKFITDLFMWHDSRALCSPPACSAFKRSDIIDRQMCFRKCGKISFGKMEDACKSYSHIAVKSVRILDLKVLYPLFKDPLLNLKIIHLVRDPRGVFLSRERFEGLKRDDQIIAGMENKTADIFEVMQEICGAQVRYYNTSMQNPPKFLKDRYMVVRYEDLVKDPVSHITSWYRYVGLKMSPVIESWIHNITQGEIPKNTQFLRLTGDSQKIAQQWRENLNFSKIRKVQEICKQAMDLFGYRFINSEKEQLNKSLDVVLTMKITP